MKRLLLALLVCWAAAGSAFGDQAAWIEKAQAEKAGQMIHPGMDIRFFCPPCGDISWTVVPVQNTEVRKASDRFYEVTVNGKGIDLAYTYIEQSGQWKNLALLLELAVSDVPEFLDSPATASSGGIASLDRALSDCLDRNITTVGMVDCMGQSYEMWDRGLNRVYKQLADRLKPDARKALKAAQLAWIKQRDLDFELIDAMYTEFEGTMFRPMQAEERMRIVKERTLKLKSWLDLMENKWE